MNAQTHDAYLAIIDAAEARVAALEAVLTDLLTGAEQQSQSHVDVAERCRAALTSEDALVDQGMKIVDRVHIEALYRERAERDQRIAALEAEARAAEARADSLADTWRADAALLGRLEAAARAVVDAHNAPDGVPYMPSAHLDACIAALATLLDGDA